MFNLASMSTDHTSQEQSSRMTWMLGWCRGDKDVSHRILQSKGCPNINMWLLKEEEGLPFSILFTEKNADCPTVPHSIRSDVEGC